MNLQIIKSVEGRAEYVLLPMSVYDSLKLDIEKILTEKQDYERFILEDYVENPIVLARIRANLTQEQLACKMGVSQAYISKLESQDSISAKVMAKIMAALSSQK